LSTEYSILFSGTGSNSIYGVIGLDNRTGNGLIYYANGFRIIDGNTSFGSNWWYITFVGNGGANGSRNLKLYRNTIQAGSTYTFDYNFTSTTPIIGANHSSFGELMGGNISMFLSTTEHSPQQKSHKTIMLRGPVTSKYLKKLLCLILLK
jgi:hypothetical protein